MSITSFGNTPHASVNQFHNDRDLFRVAASPATSKMHIQSEKESSS